MDSAYLLETLAGNFMDVVQYNDDNRGFEVRETERETEREIMKQIHAMSWHSMPAPELFVHILMIFQHCERPCQR